LKNLTLVAESPRAAVAAVRRSAPGLGGASAGAIKTGADPAGLSIARREEFALSLGDRRLDQVRVSGHAKSTQKPFSRCAPPRPGAPWPDPTSSPIGRPAALTNGDAGEREVDGWRTVPGRRPPPSSVTICSRLARRLVVRLSSGNRGCGGFASHFSCAA